MSDSPDGTVRGSARASNALRGLRPQGRASWVTAILAALTLAALLGAGGAWLGWRWAGDLPSDAQTRDLVAELAPDSTVQHFGRYDALFGYEYEEPLSWVFGSDQYRGGYVDISVDVPPDGFDALLGRVREGLIREGWRIGPSTFGTAGLTAARADLVLEVYPAQEGGASAGFPPYEALGIYFERAAPAAVTPLAIGGWVVGLALGWLAATRVAARLRRRPVPISTSATAATGAVGLLWLLPATVITSIGLADTSFFLPDTVSPADLWGAYTFHLIRPLAAVGAACLLLAAVGMVLTRSRGERLTRSV
ncbi:hypothetical protein [Micromonospora sp. NPDC051296]|uniref:hypothetical protein n=1 Tax=Micromonospora sp. NPDC051296 TaxID=3155046 RepID=UPI00341C8A07